jgi:hypothetical protein
MLVDMLKVMDFTQYPCWKQYDERRGVARQTPGRSEGMLIRRGKNHNHNHGPQAQNEPNTEPSPITAARAMTGPIIAAITMSK